MRAVRRSGTVCCLWFLNKVFVSREQFCQTETRAKSSSQVQWSVCVAQEQFESSSANWSVWQVKRPWLISKAKFKVTHFGWGRAKHLKDGYSVEKKHFLRPTFCLCCFAVCFRSNFIFFFLSLSVLTLKLKLASVLSIFIDILLCNFSSSLSSTCTRENAERESASFWTGIAWIGFSRRSGDWFISSLEKKYEIVQGRDKINSLRMELLYLVQSQGQRLFFLVGQLDSRPRGESHSDRLLVH